MCRAGETARPRAHARERGARESSPRADTAAAGAQRRAFAHVLDCAVGLTAFDVCYFFRAVVEKFDEFGEEANCTVEDVKDEIFDMVKPVRELAGTLAVCPTLADGLAC